VAETKTKRPPVIRAINGVGGVLSKIGMGGPRFTPMAIMKAAQKIAGHSDYGDESYRPGLEKLCWSLENEAELNQMGRLILHRQVANALAGRLTVVAWEKANPDAARAPIIAPMFIIGLPRTTGPFGQGTRRSRPARSKACQTDDAGRSPHARLYRHPPFWPFHTDRVYRPDLAGYGKRTICSAGMDANLSQIPA